MTLVFSPAMIESIPSDLRRLTVRSPGGTRLGLLSSPPPQWSVHYNSTARVLHCCLDDSVHVCDSGYKSFIATIIYYGSPCTLYTELEREAQVSENHDTTYVVTNNGRGIGRTNVWGRITCIGRMDESNDNVIEQVDDIGDGAFALRMKGDTHATFARLRGGILHPTRIMKYPKLRRRNIHYVRGDIEEGIIVMVDRDDDSDDGDDDTFRILMFCMFVIAILLVDHFAALSSGRSSGG